MPLNSNPKSAISIGLVFAFLGNVLCLPPAHAQELYLPAPGVRVTLSQPFNPPTLKGIKVHPDNPFRFDFILDKGDGLLADAQLKDESTRLIKYFLTSLAIPEKDLWVNLSPYEKNKIIPHSFGLTEMGRDLLAEDYMLKQITASLIFPETGLGKAFWEKVYLKAKAMYGTQNVPMDMFNKVWILADEAKIVEQNQTAYVVSAHMKVMLESDYLASKHHRGTSPQDDVAKDIVREIVLPEIEKEVNSGKNFAALRQIFYSFVLASWFKQELKHAILNQVYTGKKKIGGMHGGLVPQVVYQKYLEAYKKGAFNFIKDEVDKTSGAVVPRKYFSGGTVLSSGNIRTLSGHDDLIGANKAMVSGNHAMVTANIERVLDPASDQVKDLLARAAASDDAVRQDIYDTLDATTRRAPRAIYDALYNNTNLSLVEANDLVEASKIAAREFFTGFQAWLSGKGKDPNAKLVITFATGKSPEMAYKFIEDYLKMDWTKAETRQFLEEQGIDPDRKPDMHRVVSFHLDTVMPQKRSAYFGFANIVNKWNNRFGIPKKQRNFFYGDLTLSASGRSVRQMASEEFQALKDDIEINGLLVEQYVGGKLDKSRYPLQYAFFKAMDMQNGTLTRRLKRLGGADIIFGSVGPSNEGLGHIAFVESDNIAEKKAFIAAANHHIVAGQSSQGGGYQKLIGKVGVATFSLPDITQNKNAKMILIVLDHKKRSSVTRGVEGDLSKDLDAPLVALQKSNGVLIIDQGSGDELLVNKYPWDFRLMREEKEWNGPLRREFFIRSALRVGKKLSDLTLEDVLLSEKDKIHPMILWIRRQNMKILFKKGDFEKQRDRLAAELTDQVISTTGLAEKLWGKDYVAEFNNAKLSLKRLNDRKNVPAAELAAAQARVDRLRKTIISLDPHMDDRFLADPGAFRQLISEGHRVIAIVATPGSSSVSDQVVISMLSHMLSWTEGQIKEAREADREVLATKLKDLIEREGPFPDEHRLNYNKWDIMGLEEKDLRAQLLYNYMVQKLSLPGLQGHNLRDHEGLAWFVDFVKKSVALRPEWGAHSAQDLDTIKSTVRLIEEKSIMLSWGVAYRDVYEPVKPSWYSSVGKLGTANPQDIANIAELFKQAGRIDAVFGNGEGFSDFDAHASTEATTIAALFALADSGALDRKNFCYITYAGVWERIGTWDSNLTIVYSPDEMKRFNKLFQRSYTSQAPAQMPDADRLGLALFTENVEDNGRKTAQEVSLLVDAQGQASSLLAGGAIALNFRIRDIFDPDTREKLTSNISQLEAVGGHLRSVNHLNLYGPLPTAETPGGIALDPADMKIQTLQGSDAAMPGLETSFIVSRIKNVSGLTPVVVDIQPLTGKQFAVVLGLNN